MYVGFTKLILFAIGAAHTPTAIASSSSGTTTTDVIGNRLLQEEETCVCSPRTYTFKLNFSGTCPGNIDNEGVESTDCEPPPGDQFFGTPVEIDLVTVFENDNLKEKKVTLAHSPMAIQSNIRPSQMNLTQIDPWMINKTKSQKSYN